MKSEALKVYAVTDRTWLNGRRLADVVREVLEGGATILQVREKHLGDAEFLEEAREIKGLCEQYKVPLIINDNVAIARELGVGAHVGQSDLELQEARKMLGPKAIIGVSCQTVAQAVAAEKAGADYLGVGAVFPTGTKLDADYVSPRELAAICAAVDIPVVAIGGIGMGNLAKLGGSGIDGVAVVSALFAAPSPEQAARELARAVDDMLAVPVARVPGAIVDLDGTILDSLALWRSVGEQVLNDMGVTAEEGLADVLDYMEIPAAAAYLKEHYRLTQSVADIEAKILAADRAIYHEKARLFPGAEEFLKKLHDGGSRLALFTAASREDAAAALKRNGVMELFDCIVSTYDDQLDKASPEAYLAVLGRLGADLKQTVVYEDAPYAVAGAQATGMKTLTLEFAE